MNEYMYSVYARLSKKKNKLESHFSYDIFLVGLDPPFIYVSNRRYNNLFDFLGEVCSFQEILVLDITKLNICR